VRNWLSRRQNLPRETRMYVQKVTGRSAEEWIGVQQGDAARLTANTVSCEQMASLSRQSAGGLAIRTKPLEPWGVELVGSSSEEKALAAYRQLQRKYAAILAGREPMVVFHGRARGSMGWARVRIGEASRANADRLCASLHAAGANCWVLRN
jgi:hypothetical protein